MTNSSWQTARHRIDVTTSDYTPALVARRRAPGSL